MVAKVPPAGITTYKGTPSAGDLGSGLHIKTADSGGDVHATGDEFVLENSGDCGMTILSGTGSHGRISFGDSGDNNIGYITYDHGSNNMSFIQNAATQFSISGSTAVTTLAIVDDEIGTGGETAPDVGTGGITLNQGASDNNIITLKSSDVAHGITDDYETDTYAIIKKYNGNQGGFRLEAMTEDSIALMPRACYTTGDTTKSTGAVAPIFTDARKKSGSTLGNPASNENIFAVTSGFSTKFIVDAEGELHSDGGAQSAYDTYEDAHLVRAYDLSHGKGVIDSKFDKFISYNHEKLADMKLVGREEDGTPNHFINITGMQRLHNGAIWQQYEKHQKLANAMYELAKAAVGEEKANEILEENDIKLLN